MLNVSGHLLSTAEVESALAEHRAVAEAAAVSFPHEIKGQALFCYVVLKEEFAFTEGIEQELRYIGKYINHILPHMKNPISQCINLTSNLNSHNSSTQDWSSGLTRSD